MGDNMAGKYEDLIGNGSERELDAAFLQLLDEFGWKWMPAPSNKQRDRSPILSVGDSVVWHWTGSGRTAESLGNLWRNDSRVVSSHAGVDESGVIWYVMPHKVSFHAGKANGSSIGIDICAPPLHDSRGISTSKGRGIYMGPCEAPYQEYQRLHPDVLRNISMVTRVVNMWGDFRYLDHADVDPGRKVDCLAWREQLAQIGCYDGLN